MKLPHNMNWKPRYFLFILSVLPSLLFYQLDGLNGGSALSRSNNNGSTSTIGNIFKDSINPKNEYSHRVKLREKQALFFAINEYQDTTWEDLKNPIQEVDSIARVLKDYYGFDTTIYRNSTKAEVEEILELWQNKTFGEGAQLFVFFSGHGAFNDEVV